MNCWDSPVCDPLLNHLVDLTRQVGALPSFVVTASPSLCMTFYMSGIIAVVAYRPKPGREHELLQLVRSRVPTLRKEGLVTDRVPTVMRSRDGTLIEVSEWKSHAAIDAAHRNPNVLAMWDKFFALCDCVPLKTLAEAEEMFAGFEPVVD